jgi:large subunit ribosomal protein L13
MLPKGTMGRDMFRKLHVYAGEAHPHSAQQPAALDLGKVIAKKNAK